MFFVDSLYSQSSTARDQPLAEAGAITMERRLNDGRTFRIVKVYHEPAQTAAELKRLGWDITVKVTLNYFLYGSGEASDQKAIPQR